LNTLAAIQLNRSIQYSQSINSTMSLVKHNRTTVAKPTRNILKTRKKRKKTKHDCRKNEEANIVHKHAPNTNNLMEVMVESRFTGSG